MTIESDEALRDVLSAETITVVGCSSTPGKAAHDVPAYLRRQGYDVIPVNPFADEIFDRSVPNTLADVDEDVDIVCIFRPSGRSAKSSTMHSSETTSGRSGPSKEFVMTRRPSEPNATAATSSRIDV